MNFYPHHIGDFNNSTRHLTRVERSVYRDAIELQYDSETVLTKDFDRLAKRLICVSDEEKSALKAVLEEFFTLKEDGYMNERCFIEIEKYRANTSAKARAGIASAASRQRKSTHVEHPLNTCATNQEPITNNQEPSLMHNPSGLLSAAKLPDCAFETFWKAYPKKKGIATARKAFNKLRPSQDLLQMILRAITIQAGSADWQMDDGKFIPYPATWINGQRWLDETEATKASVYIDPDSRAGVEAEAMAKGMGPWDAMTEQFHIYSARVRAAENVSDSNKFRERVKGKHSLPPPEIKGRIDEILKGIRA